MCSAIYGVSEGSPHDRSGGSGATPGPTVTVWMRQGPLHQDVGDRPEGFSLRVFYFEEARA